MAKVKYSNPETTAKIVAFLEQVKKYGSQSRYIGMDDFEDKYVKQERFRSEFKRFEEIVKTIHQNDPDLYHSWYDCFKDDRQYLSCQAFYTDTETGTGYQVWREAPKYKYEKARYGVHVYKPATLDNKIEVMQRKADGLEREIHYRNERMKRMCGRIIDDMKAENAAAAKQLNEVLTELSQLREEKRKKVA
jgi:hypothetical protein